MQVLVPLPNGHWQIPELEVSITNKCSLACRECGFLVPNQPEPWGADLVNRICECLALLKALGVQVDTLAILGGEPTLFGGLLGRVATAIKRVSIADHLEVVSNGMTPEGMTPEVLEAVDRFTLSVYVDHEKIVDLWREWLERAAPHVSFRARRNEAGWDQWTGDLRVSPAEAQRMFDTCWYRKHCVTIERGRLFACSRIAKHQGDSEGLEINARTTIDDVREFLGRPAAFASCASCLPMMNLKPVPPGVQPDNRISKLEARAIAVLESRVRRP